MSLNEGKTENKSGVVQISFLRAGIPAMVAISAAMLYSLTDVFYAAWFGTSGQGAIAAVFPAVQLMTAIGVLYAGIVTFGAFGKRSHDGRLHTWILVILGGAAGIALIVTMLCFAAPVLKWLDTPAAALPLAAEYATVSAVGFIFGIFNLCIGLSLSAAGHGRAAVIPAIIGIVLNAALDPILMFSLNIGIRGAAASTVISQAVASLIYFAYIIKKRSSVDSLHIQSADKHVMLAGTNLSVVYLVLSAVSTVMTNNSASAYGASSATGFGVAAIIMAVLSYAVFGFITGLRFVVSRAYTEGNYTDVKQKLGITLGVVTAFSVICAAVLLLLSKNLMMLFSGNDLYMINYGMRSLRANGVIFAFFGLEQSVILLLPAMGNILGAYLPAVGRCGLFFIPPLQYLTQLFGIDGLVWVQPLADFITVIPVIILAVRQYRKLKK